MIDVYLTVLVKGSEKYFFFWTPATRQDALRTLGRFATNPDLSFTWYDAAVLAKKIREEPADSNSRFSKGTLT